MGEGHSNSTRMALRAAIYAALFLAAMVLAINLARFGGNVAPIWIASAILAWGLVSGPLRDWPALLGACTVVHVAHAIYAGDTAPQEVIYLCTDIGGPWACAALLRRIEDPLAFEDRRSVFRFLVIGGLIAPAVSAFIVAAGSLISPERFRLQDLGTWVLSVGLGYLVFLPIFHSIRNGTLRDLASHRLRAKAVLLLGLLIAAEIAAWYLPGRLHAFFLLAAAPYFVLIAFELGSPGARAALAIVAIIMLADGLFVPRSPDALMGASDFLLAAQIYIAALAAWLLPLVAALEEKNRLYESASSALADAQSAWGELIAAEAHYRLIADNARDMVMRIDLSGVVIFASPACRIICADEHELEGRKILDFVHPEDVPRVRTDLEAFMASGEVDRPHKIRARLLNADAGWRTLDIVATLISSGGRQAEEVIVTLREADA